MAELGPHRYGKSGIRVVRVLPGEGGDDLLDATVDVEVEGDFHAAHAAGDNREVLPTDTMKNLVYAFCARAELGEIEELGLALAGHLVEEVPACHRAVVRILRHPWGRMTVEGEPHPHAFLAEGGEERTAVVTRHRELATVEAGVSGLRVLKTTGSAFTGFLRDDYTTLEEQPDRILATAIEAEWLYERPDVDHARLWNGVRRTILETFAGHDESASVQHTAYAMGQAVLGAHEEVRLIRFRLPNLHHLPVDVGTFGGDRSAPVYQATDRPYGLIEATIRR